MNTNILTSIAEKCRESCGGFPVHFETEEIKAISNLVNMALEGNLFDWTNSEIPPKANEYVMLHFQNYPIPAVGLWKGNDAEGGSYYLAGFNNPLNVSGIFVDKWAELPR